jgi:hypothetical protein
MLTKTTANTTGIGWEAALVKAKAFVAQLTSDEKDDMVVCFPISQLTTFEFQLTQMFRLENQVHVLATLYQFLVSDSMVSVSRMVPLLFVLPITRVSLPPASLLPLHGIRA